MIAKAANRDRVRSRKILQMGSPEGAGECGGFCGDHGSKLWAIVLTAYQGSLPVSHSRSTTCIYSEQSRLKASQRLIIRWLQVRIPQGPPVLSTAYARQGAGPLLHGSAGDATIGIQRVMGVRCKGNRTVEVLRVTFAFGEIRPCGYPESASTKQPWP